MELTFWDYFLSIVFLFLIIIYFKTKAYFFKDRYIKTLPLYPIVGNMWDVLSKKASFIEIIDKAYTSFPDEKYVGFYQFLRPSLIIRDIDVIKKLAVKDFESFPERQTIINEDNDPVFGKNLSSLKGQKWRDMRATLSPAFTSSKMKNMFNFIADCGEYMTEYYSNEIKNQANLNGVLEIEMKDTFTRYTNDVIATSAFGVKVNSFEDKNNDFYQMGKEISTFPFSRLLKIFGLTSAPALMKVFKITFFSSKLHNFFKGLVINQMLERERDHIIRPDIINLLMEAKKGALKHDSVDEPKDVEFATVEESLLGKRTVQRQWDDDDLAAQAIIFFLAGFDTSSTLLSFLAHELTLKPLVQRNLQCEIDKVKEKNNGKLQYSGIQNMKYMDMVVSEALRKWPPGHITDRKCVKTYKLPPSNPSGNEIQINPDDGIWIPIYSIHRDPKYYKNPNDFDPERFSDENKSSIQPFTYLPFGLGSRNCIGSRFALMEIKTVIFYMLSKFDFVPTSKTINPLTLGKASLGLGVEGGFWIGLKVRDRNSDHLI